MSPLPVTRNLIVLCGDITKAIRPQEHKNIVAVVVEVFFKIKKTQN